MNTPTVIECPSPQTLLASLGVPVVDVILPRADDELGHTFDWPLPLTHVTVADWAWPTSHLACSSTLKLNYPK
jgi:hypothetical protein